MIKRITVSLSVVLALIFAVLMPMNVFAEAKPVYISEFKVAYGKDGKTQLKDAGYTVVDGNLNDGNTKKDSRESLESVWIGYKTTEDKEEAITDIASMTMKGNYSFVDYKSMLEKQNKEAADLAEKFLVAINELRANVKAESKTALKVIEMLNSFYEDDSQMNFGDFLMDETKSTKENLTKVFLQGNMQILAKIEQLITIGLTETGETFADRLAKSSFGNSFDDLTETNKYIIDDIQTYQINLQNFLDAEEKAKDEYGDEYDSGKFIDYIFESGNYSDTQIMSLQETASLREISSRIKYTSAAMTLETIINIPYTKLSDYTLNPLADSLTDGQRAALPVVGLTVVLSAAFDADARIDSIKDTFDSITKDVTGKLSVYSGIDRSLFNDPDSVALTTLAHKESGSTTGSSWTQAFEEREYKGTFVKTWTLIVAGVTAAIGVTLYAIGYNMSGKYQAILNEIFRPNSWSANYYDKQVALRDTFKMVGNIGFCIMAAVAVIMTILAILELVHYQRNIDKEYQEYLNSTYEHGPIPRVIVDTMEVDGKQKYVNYYAVRDLNGNIADINGRDGIDGKSFNYQWNVIYTTKDTAAGKPIRAEGFVMTVSHKQYTSKNMLPIHDFEKGAEGVKTAADLNFGASNSGLNNYKALYAYYQNNETNGTLAGTTFTEGSAILFCAVSFVAGCGIMFIVMMAVNSKKKKEAQA